MDPTAFPFVCALDIFEIWDMIVHSPIIALVYPDMNVFGRELMDGILGIADDKFKESLLKRYCRAATAATGHSQDGFVNVSDVNNKKILYQARKVQPDKTPQDPKAVHNFQVTGEAYQVVTLNFGDFYNGSYGNMHNVFIVQLQGPFLFPTAFSLPGSRVTNRVEEAEPVAPVFCHGFAVQTGKSNGDLQASSPGLSEKDYIATPPVQDSDGCQQSESVIAREKAHSRPAPLIPALRMSATNTRSVKEHFQGTFKKDVCHSLGGGTDSGMDFKDGLGDQTKEINYEVLTEELLKVAEPVFLQLIIYVERIGPVFKRRPMFMNSIAALRKPATELKNLRDVVVKLWTSES
ncbi:hypothetical protein Tco_0032939 [Tanacetum coccineum]